MAIKIMSVQVPAAQIQAMVASQSSYIDRKGNLLNCGAAAPQQSTIFPPDPLDLSIYQHVWVHVFSGVQTGAVGGQFQMGNIVPNPSIVGTTGVALQNLELQLAIAATASKQTLHIFDNTTPSATQPLRMGLAVPILFFTTVPSPATPIFIEIWGATMASQYG